jgi:hypothetical protein
MVDGDNESTAILAFMTLKRLRSYTCKKCGAEFDELDELRPVTKKNEKRLRNGELVDRRFGPLDRWRRLCLTWWARSKKSAISAVRITTPKTMKTTFTLTYTVHEYFGGPRGRDRGHVYVLYNEPKKV